MATRSLAKIIPGASKKIAQVRENKRVFAIKAHPDQIIALKLRNPDLVDHEGAKLLGISRGHLHDILRENNLKWSTICSDLADLKGSKADMLAIRQERLLARLTEPEVLGKAGVRDLAVAADLLNKIERLERGQSTGNIMTLTTLVVAACDDSPLEID